MNRFLGRCENTDGAHIFIQQVTLTENDANDEADGFIIKITTVSHGGGGGSLSKWRPFCSAFHREAISTSESDGEGSVLPKMNVDAQ